MTTQELLARARQARGAMALADTQTKDRALLAMAEELEADMAPILAANALDLEGARGRISEVMLDRLALSPDRIAGMAKGIREVAALPDPVGAVLSRVERPNGLVIEKTAVPMGVIAIIYESRPNVTSDAAALALKAGSACVLRCGKEAHRSAAASHFRPPFPNWVKGRKIPMKGLISDAQASAGVLPPDGRAPGKRAGADDGPLAAPRPDHHPGPLPVRGLPVLPGSPVAASG